MTSPKARFNRPPFQLALTGELDAKQKATLIAIKNDSTFVADITQIANLYADRRIILKYSHPSDEESKSLKVGERFVTKRVLREPDLSLGDTRKTFQDLESSASILAEKLENLPEDLEMGLWRLREQWRHLGIEIRGDNVSLPNLLRDLTAEISRVVSDDLIDGKPGRKKASLEQRTADSLRDCFKRHGLKVSRAPRTLIDCLEIIFNVGKNHLSREALVIYVKKGISEKA